MSQPPARRVLIAVPFYQNAHLVGTLSASLRDCAAELAGCGAEIVFYNDSPGHAALAAALEVSQAGLDVRVQTNPANLGFVQTMNLAMAEAAARGLDVLLLNSDTRVMPGALSEMLRILRLDSTHGFVNPRSDNATIATLPLQDRLGGRTGDDALPVCRAFTARLPPFSYVPTAVGFCLLIRWEVIAEFGGFDEIYGKGYNEENDLVMRASRVGFRAVLANHAFVSHVGEASFSLTDTPRLQWERRNRAILDARYPEYASHTKRYYDSPALIAERLLACLVPDAAGMMDVALDCSHFVAARNGTFQAGRQLAAAAAAAWSAQYRLHVLCSPGVFAFHDFASLGVRLADPHGGQSFAAIFRVGQPYDWNALQRLCMTGAVLGVYMLDTISFDCPRLASAPLENLWQFTVDQIDVLAMQSRQTDRALRLRLRVPEGLARVVVPHSLDSADYLPFCDPVPDGAGTLLVVGNHYAHKYVTPTANALASALPDRQVVALGVRRTADDTAPDCPPDPDLLDLPNLTAIALGRLEEAEIAAHYRNSAVVIFPSFAEGFGFPTLNALAAGRPLLARRLPATEEIRAALGDPPNLHFYDTTQELVSLVRRAPQWTGGALQPGPPQSAARIGEALRAAMEQASFGRIVARVQAMQLASDIGKSGALAPVDPPAVAASLVAARVEQVARRVFAWPWLFGATRRLVRLGRRFGLIRPGG